LLVHVGTFLIWSIYGIFDTSVRAASYRAGKTKEELLGMVTAAGKKIKTSAKKTEIIQFLDKIGQFEEESLVCFPSRKKKEKKIKKKKKKILPDTGK